MDYTCEIIKTMTTTEWVCLGLFYGCAMWKLVELVAKGEWLARWIVKKLTRSRND